MNLPAITIERALGVVTGKANVGVEVESRVQSTGHTIKQDDRYPERDKRGILGTGLRGFENVGHPSRVSPVLTFVRIRSRERHTGASSCNLTARAVG